MNTTCHSFKELQKSEIKYHEPVWDVENVAEGCRLSVQIPGVHKSSVELKIDADTLSLTATRSDVASPEWRVVQAMSRPSVYRLKLRLRQPFLQESVTASLENGILSVFLPRPAEPEARSIEVN